MGLLSCTLEADGPCNTIQTSEKKKELQLKGLYIIKITFTSQGEGKIFLELQNFIDSITHIPHLRKILQKGLLN